MSFNHAVKLHYNDNLKNTKALFRYSLAALSIKEHVKKKKKRS